LMIASLFSFYYHFLSTVLHLAWWSKVLATSGNSGVGAESNGVLDGNGGETVSSSTSSTAANTSIRRESTSSTSRIRDCLEFVDIVFGIWSSRAGLAASLVGIAEASRRYNSSVHDVIAALWLVGSQLNAISEVSVLVDWGFQSKQLLHASGGVWTSVVGSSSKASHTIASSQGFNEESGFRRFGNSEWFSVAIDTSVGKGPLGGDINVGVDSSRLAVNALVNKSPSNWGVLRSVVQVIVERISTELVIACGIEDWILGISSDNKLINSVGGKEGKNGIAEVFASIVGQQLISGGIEDSLSPWNVHISSVDTGESPNISGQWSQSSLNISGGLHWDDVDSVASSSASLASVQAVLRIVDDFSVIKSVLHIVEQAVIDSLPSCRV